MDTVSHVRMNLSLGVEKRQRTRKQCTVFGVSGLPLFSYLQLFNIIRVVPIDYIHCVLLGIVKMHLTLWFDKTHGNEPFSIAPRISEVDKCLHAIKTPSFITRFPRSLTKIAHFKAAELKNYSLHALLEFLLRSNFSTFPCLFFFHIQTPSGQDFIQRPYPLQADDLRICPDCPCSV